MLQMHHFGSSSAWRRLLLRTEPASRGRLGWPRLPEVLPGPAPGPPSRPALGAGGSQAHPAQKDGDSGPWRLPSRARTRPEVSEPFLILSTTERKFRKAAARRRDTLASRHRALNAQARRLLSFLLFLLPVSRRQRLLGPMSRRALGGWGEQRGQEPLGPGATQFVLHDDDDVEEEMPKAGSRWPAPPGRREGGVRVNNRFELVRHGATWGGGSRWGRCARRVRDVTGRGDEVWAAVGGGAKEVGGDLRPGAGYVGFVPRGGRGHSVQGRGKWGPGCRGVGRVCHGAGPRFLVGGASLL